MKTPKTKTLSALRALAALAVPLHLTGAALVYPTAVAAQTLPNPYVSRALDAVLLPIDATVTSAFALAADDTGVLVLAVEPGGVADTSGIAPGDVITMVKGHVIIDPIDLDAVVYYWLEQGLFDFVFDGWHEGQSFSTASVVTYESYIEVIEITTVETWTSYSSESFSYSEYYAEYSEEMTETYESSETTIEESVTSEEFTAEMTEETTEDTTDDMAGDAVDDGSAVADDGTTDEAAMDDGSADDSAAAEADDMGACGDGTAEPCDDGTADMADDSTDDMGDDGADAGSDEVEE